MKFNLSKFVKYLKGANFALAALFLVLVTIVAYNYGPNAAIADMNHATPGEVNVPVVGGGMKNITVQGVNEHLASDGTYSVTYRFSQDIARARGEQPQDVTFDIRTDVHKCPEGNGHVGGTYPTFCVDADAEVVDTRITLNAANNWKQEITIFAKQKVAQVCGSFQTDMFSRDMSTFITGSIYRSGVDCSYNPPSGQVNIAATPVCVGEESKINATVTTNLVNPVLYSIDLNGVNVHASTNPSVTLNATPGQTYNLKARVQTPYYIYDNSNTVTVKALDCKPKICPSGTRMVGDVCVPEVICPSGTVMVGDVCVPNSTPVEGQCPMNLVHKIIDSTIVCVAQDQEQNQSQIQNNNQNQNVNQNVNATGGNSSSSSSSSNNVNVKVN